jgi:hypothetical protein
MVDNVCAIYPHQANEVSPQALSCLCMVEGSVGVSFPNCLVLAALVLVCRSCFYSLLKFSLSISPNLKLFMRYDSHFFIVVKKLDQKLAIMNEVRGCPNTPGPNLSHRSHRLDAHG